MPYRVLDPFTIPGGGNSTTIIKSKRSGDDQQAGVYRTTCEIFRVLRKQTLGQIVRAEKV